MATLAESFLADLEDLSDGEGAEEREGEGDLTAFGDGFDGGMGADDIEALNYDNLDSVAMLAKSDRYKRIMQAVKASLQVKEVSEANAKLGAVEDNPEYKLIVECNSLMVDVENEITIIHNFIRDKYRLKFPELESLVMHPIDYARVVKTIGNEMDMTVVNLDGLLPSATIMVVSVTGSTTNGKELDEENLAKVLEACDQALELDESKKELLEFVEDRMQWIAPNLSFVTGSAIAAQLMGVAGGLMNLSKMPSCNVMILGAKKKRLDGYSTASINPHSGYLINTEIVQSTPPALRMRAGRLVAGKCTLMARMDSFGQDPLGTTGAKMRDEVKAKIEKWQEPPPPKQPKPLPVPDLEGKKRRGGRRLRKMKERYGMTDMRKAANRMNFNQPEEEVGLTGEGIGLLGAAEGGGKLRIQSKGSKLASKAAKKMKEKKYGSSGSTSGLSSSVAFTPIQGIELVNPEQPQQDTRRDGTESYFSETGSFSKVRRLG
mmetsp:Transcript_9641/g.18075  ORF Transcript_9641/g.18075 Transcript_9641/m.18075 type:complete len:490 (-) Transcript_9641:177-1646(-)|eukprot:CAMPEP_0114292342 /NCGR_PEP_ID=MMETSP0059-20121206/9008_1 /TAXON_ID=36894 /ORGANISM="Pyramimonas parkeae, Strain CCMP726" /LENGTH=489 /DNA_ID=CAMNT_0001413979 /DNA_START=27 /DNA_END=1496 /DNA_ORIENTATION=-